jgi:hypothetical protein
MTFLEIGPVKHILLKAVNKFPSLHPYLFFHCVKLGVQDLHLIPMSNYRFLKSSGVEAIHY